MQWRLMLDTHSLPVFELSYSHAMSAQRDHLNQPKSRSEIKSCVTPLKRLLENTSEQGFIRGLGRRPCRLDHGLTALTVLTSYPKVKQRHG